MTTLTRRLLACACIASLLCSVSLHARTTAADNDGPLTLNMQDADIGALIETVSYMTGRNFIVDPRVTGRVTIVSAVPTEPNEIYDLFLSVLRVHGFAAIETGDVVKIIPDANAKFENSPVLAVDPDNMDDGITTLVIKLNNVTATELVPVLRPLLPQSAHLAAHEGSNMLIAADTASNLARLRRIIKRIDLDTDRSIEVIRLQYANATDLVQVIMPAYQGPATPGAGGNKQPPGSKINLLADERTNSILLSGDESEKLRVRALISHLDTPVEQKGDTEVIYLKYAVASELVPILQRLGNRLGITEEEKQQATQGAGGESALFEIEADDNMNALVIHAPQQRLEAVKSVIRQLDIRRAQVLVEGVIAEVSYDKSVELGIQWQTSTPTPGTGFFAGSSQSGSDLSAESISAFDPVSLGVGLSLGYFSNGNLRSLLRAIAGDTYSNILSTPTLMTLDNEEAEIVIGQNVPFITGQFTNSTTSPDNPFQTIERRDVGIVLKVKPQINEGDSVKLEIEQEISSIDTSATSSSSGSDLITNKRSIKTNVLVDDGKVVVLGGLLEDDIQENQSKVPLLGDIPVLGNLFRNTRDRLVKTNLMIFLRPQIVRDARTNSELTVSKYDYIRNEQRRLQKDGLTLLPSTKITELPHFDEVEDSSNHFIPPQGLDIIDDF